MNIVEKLINGNFQFQWKLIKDIENIDIQGKIPKYPVLILTCMDPRIDVHRIFQLEPGDVFVLRNAGNILTVDMIRSILIAIHEYNIKYIVVLGHLDCGMTKITLNRLKLKLLPASHEFICRAGHNPLVELRDFFEPFIDELENIKNQIKELKNFKGFPVDVEITGILYDIDTGWIFDYDMIRELKFIENFGKKYRDLLYMKRLNFVDFLEANENQIVNSGGLITKSGEGVKIEFNDVHGPQDPSINKKAHDNLINQENATYAIEKPLYKFPKIRIPKIILPKIKVNMPNIYKKNKQEGE